MNKNRARAVRGSAQCGKIHADKHPCGVGTRPHRRPRRRYKGKKQWIRINDRLELLDSPGLLWPRLDNQTAAARLAITGALNDDILDKEELALELVKQVSAAYPENLCRALRSGRFRRAA